MEAPFDPVRRRFLTGRPAAAPPPPRPPWLIQDRLTDLCTRCGACATACP
ncbi:MAG: 4Fe-4S binding protein, partial [Rhodospirillales bacterium]|nr:4Fe-4S binding protein [Rhodospirillales bacterium]